MYSSHNNNIKYVDLIIKYIGFKLFHYTINLNVVSSFMIFNDFDYIFLSIYYSLEFKQMKKKEMCVIQRKTVVFRNIKTKTKYVIL